MIRMRCRFDWSGPAWDPWQQHMDGSFFFFLRKLHILIDKTKYNAEYKQQHTKTSGKNTA